MSIFDIFSSSKDSSSTSGEDNGGNSVVNSSNDPSKEGKSNLSDPNPATNNDGKMVGTNQTPENPLDIYSKMFENAAKNSDIQAPQFKLDPKIVDDVSSKLDFTQAVPKELMEKALTGDVKALLGVIQATTQNAYKTALQHGTSLTDTYINQRSEFDQSKINSGVKRELTHQALSDAPNFSHPVIKQAKANPDASPQEIARSAKAYITDLASALNPSSKTGSENGEAEMDWSKYLSS
jgi:hypothetical protein